MPLSPFVAGDLHVAQCIASMKRRRVPIVGVGNSNAQQDGAGYDEAFQKEIHERFGMYSTAANAQSAGSLARPAGTGDVFGANGQATGAGLPFDDLFGDVGGIWNGGYDYVPGGSSGGSNANASMVTYGAYQTMPRGYNGAMTVHWEAAEFTTGSGSWRAIFRREATGFPTIASLPTQSSGGPADAIKRFSMDVAIPAGTEDNNHGLRMSGTVTGPALFGHGCMEYSEQLTGGSYNPIVAEGGASYREQLSILRDWGVEALAQRLDFIDHVLRQRGQLSSPVVMLVNEDLNHRNETLASIGPNPVSDGDSPEAVFDNLAGIRQHFIDALALLGRPASDLHMLVLSAWPVSDPDDLELWTYRAAASRFAQSTDRVLAYDLGARLPHSVAQTYYRVGGTDTNHFEQPGYEHVTGLLFDDMVGIGENAGTLADEIVAQIERSGGPLDLLRKAKFNRKTVSFTTGENTLYDDDGTTPILRRTETVTSADAEVTAAANA